MGIQSYISSRLRYSSCAGNPTYTCSNRQANDGNAGLKDVDVSCQGVSTRTMLQEKIPNALINTEKVDSVSWKFKYDNIKTLYLKDGTNYGGNYAIANPGDYDNQWILEPVTKITITPSITDGEWISKPLYTSFQYECGPGVSAWYANSDTLLVQIRDGKVPANTAVVLRCDTSKNDYYIVPIFDNVSSLSDNILQGLCLNKDSINSSGKKFYAGDEEWNSSNETYILPSNSVYINVASDGNESGAKFLNNNTTAIDEIHHHNNKHNNVYDIAGRKVNRSLESLSKGIYIINGKKVIIK